MSLVVTAGYTWVDGEVVTATKMNSAATPTIADGQAANFSTITASGHVTFEGVTSAGATGTGNLVFASSPTLTTPNLGTPSTLVITNATGDKLGTTTNDSATALHVGEYISSSVASGSAVAAVNNTAVNITSISLTAGDWDVSGMVYYVPDGSTVWDLFIASSSSTSATHGSRDTGAQGILKVAGGFGTGIASSQPAPLTRFSLSGTTTVYLIGTISFSAGSPTMYGTIRARRVR